MTPLPIQFLEFALEDLSEAERYYSSRSPALGQEFIDTIEHALARLRAFPESGASYLDGTRRLVLERFPFALVYLVQTSTIVIVAVAHQRRKPGYWRDR